MALEGWPDAPDALIVAVGHGMYPKRQALRFRVSPDAADELVNAFQAEGLEVGPVPMASVGPEELALFAVVTGGSLTGVAAVLRTFFNRHQHRAFLLHADGSIEMKGMSPVEMERCLEVVLRDALDRQEQSDELWDQVMPAREDDDQ